MVIERRLGLALVGILVTSAGHSAATFTPIDELVGQPVWELAGISDDGAVLVGTTGGGGSAFRWSANNGIQLLPSLFPNPGGAKAFGVSGNGAVVVGQSNAPGSIESVRWVNAGTAQDLTGFGAAYYFEGGYDASFDGSRVVGSFGMWDAASNQLSTIGFGRAITPDGAVVVGGGNPLGCSSGYMPFRWTAATGTVILGNLGGSQFCGSARGVSADGSIVVGFADYGGGPNEQAFIWTASAGMVGLGFMPNVNAVTSRALAVSADGHTVVGTSAGAFIWTPEVGMQSLLEVLLHQGASGLDGWELNEAIGISADGRTIIGQGSQYQNGAKYFIATLNAVPIPAAFWLFGGAIGTLVWMRRKASLG